MRVLVAIAVMIAITALVTVQSALAEGDAAAGKKAFNKCKACHSLEAGKNKVGPSLAGIFGRRAGSVDGFKYSKAMQAADVTWDDSSITAYLNDPKGFIPGNKMVFPGFKKEADVTNLLAYLKEAAK